MKPKITFILCVLLPILYSCHDKTQSTWRGPDRNGVFPETGLLKQWPANGPELLWQFDSLLMGHSSPAVTPNAIYVTGMPDSITGYLFCIDHKGNLLWKDCYGEEYKANYTGSRSTPVVTGKHLYLMTGLGELICYHLLTREKVWTRSFQNDFNAEPQKYGNAETVLVKGEKLFCTPGGTEQSVVCLNRFTGETLWKAPGIGESCSYSSTTIVTHNNKEILLAVLEKSIVGIDPNKGELLWQVPFEAVYINHASTPVYNNGRIYASGAAGEGKGGIIAVELNKDGSEASIKWQRKDIPNHLSGMIVQDSILFTCGDRRKPWHCLNTENGDTLYTWEDFPYGNISYADGLFYVLANEGEILLCSGTAESFDIISRFKPGINIYDPFAPLWAFPVIENKRLYIRHKGTLFVYNLAAV